MAASSPMLMATQAGTTSQTAGSTATNKQTILAKSLHARATTNASMGQCNNQAQTLNTVASFSAQQVGLPNVYDSQC